MDPFVLRTDRLVLDQPGGRDIDDIARYCTDPVFERYLVTPWPYERAHAEGFVNDYVLSGWSSGSEWTWAIRMDAGAPLLGVVGVRLASGMVGYWLGAAHRGRGILPEALGVVIDAVFERTDRERVLWECVVGNVASMRVAQKCGFRFTGEAPGLILGRDGSPTLSWTGELDREGPREPTADWPIP